MIRRVEAYWSYEMAVHGNRQNTHQLHPPLRWMSGTCRFAHEFPVVLTYVPPATQAICETVNSFASLEADQHDFKRCPTTLLTSRESTALPEASSTKKGTPCGRMALNGWSESKKNWGTVRSSGMKGAGSEATISDMSQWGTLEWERRGELSRNIEGFIGQIVST